ncbi:MAG: hypothetical protein R3E95_00030 [Thiolinea sp.]
MKKAGKLFFILAVLALAAITLWSFWLNQSQLEQKQAVTTVWQTHAPWPELTAEIPVLSPGPRPPVGINANELHFEDASFPFVDLFRQSAPFKDNVLELEDGAQADYDVQGWPLRLNGGEAGTKFLGKIPAAALAAGDYLVLYDGNGTLRYGHGVELVAQTPGRDTIRLHADKTGEVNASLVITALDETDPLRNIRIPATRRYLSG